MARFQLKLEQQSLPTTVLGPWSLPQRSGYIPGQGLQSSCWCKCNNVFLFFHPYEVDATKLIWMLPFQGGTLRCQIVTAIFAWFLANCWQVSIKATIVENTCNNQKRPGLCRWYSNQIWWNRSSISSAQQRGNISCKNRTAIVCFDWFQMRCYGRLQIFRWLDEQFQSQQH